MKSRIYIEAFDCITSTGKNPEAFWRALDDGMTGVKKTSMDSWPLRFKDFWVEHNHQPIACKINPDSISALEMLSSHLSQLAIKCLENTNSSSRMGIIFASTKGAIEDHVWKSNFAIEIDPLDEVLQAVIKKLPNIDWALKQIVSNSCASSHAAFSLGKAWIESGACQKVLVIAGDIIGPFIHTGFQTLKALSVEGAKPFQASRDGLVLGEAMTAVLLSNEVSELELMDCQIFNEAHTVTGASPEGRGLSECINRLSIDHLQPDFVIAHGTATSLNDQIEDRALSLAQKKFNKDFPITGTKWSVGHTLGASGSVDLIAAVMSLKNQKIFSLNVPVTEKPEGFLAKNYVYHSREKSALESVLVTSLGFGGTNGALVIRRRVS